MFSLLTQFGSVTAAESMRQYVMPVIQTLCIVAALACVFFIVNGGIHYMTSRGKPDNLEHAKRVLKNAIIGLILVLGAATVTTILTHAFPATNTSTNAGLPQLQNITSETPSNGLIDVMLTAITGFLNVIIQAIGAPFLAALSYFTTSTPLMEQNSAVFNLWLAMVGITDVLFILVIALLGFHVMSATSFGFNEIDIKHLLPRIGLIFLLSNTSIFAIDGIIGISNALVKAVTIAGGNVTVWSTLTDVVKQASGESLAALLLMLVFLVFVVVLLVYYVGRLITLFIGAVLSPIMLVIWLIPGFRDFTETAAKVYVTTIFVLFVHTVILALAASLFEGMVALSPTHVPNTFMAMITGLATIFALLKTQGVMAQLSYVSLGPRTARQLGGQFINAVTTISNVRSGIVAGAKGAGKAIGGASSPSTWAPRYGSNAGQPVAATAMTGAGHSTANKPKPSVTVTRTPATVSSARKATGTTTVAPKMKADLSDQAKVSTPINRTNKGGKS